MVEVDAVRVCLPHFFDVPASECVSHNAVRRRIFLNPVDHKIHAVGIDHRHDIKSCALIKFQNIFTAKIGFVPERRGIIARVGRKQ